MTDVAVAAGVSMKTVSRVINGRTTVRADVKKRVEAAIVQLSYHPNAFARGLVRQRSHLIGLVYENPSPSYFVELQRGVLHQLDGSSYRLVVMPVGSIASHAGEVVSRLRAAALDGVVLGPPAGDHPSILQDLEQAGICFARIAPTRMLDEAPAVLIEDATAAEAIADHLLSLGHREIAIIKGAPHHPSCAARMTGYERAFRRAGVAIRHDRIDTGLYTHEGGEAAGRRLLSRIDLPTAILAQNDDMAVGAICAARDLGIAVPDRLSVAGFDNAAVARISWPRLTTMHQPVFEMAAAATAMVVAQLEGLPFDSQVGYDHRLMIRESTTVPFTGR